MTDRRSWRRFLDLKLTWRLYTVMDSASKCAVFLGCVAQDGRDLREWV